MLVSDVPVNEAAKTRIEEDDAVAVNNGFAPRPPMYKAGTPLNKMGLDNWGISHESVETLPRRDAALDQFNDLIRTEKRKDIAIKGEGIAMIPTGHLVINDELYALEDDVWPQFCAANGLSQGTQLLRKCSPVVRTHVVNEFLRKSRREVVYRTRTYKEQKSVFAVVSPGYGKCDVDQIAEICRLIISPEAATETFYDGYKARFTFLWHSEVPAEEAAAGEYFKAGVTTSGGDNAKAMIKTRSSLWRNLCRNLYFVDEYGKEQYIVHKGNSADIQGKLVHHVRESFAQIGHFRTKWAEAGRENMLEKLSCSNIRDVFSKLIEKGHIEKMGNFATTMEGLMQAHAKEARWGNPTSKQAVINTIARWAHEKPYKRTQVWKQDDIQAQAGQLLYVHQFIQ